MTAQLLLTIAIRTCVIAAFSLVAGVALRKARPSTRSALWNSTLIACLFMPAAWTVTPPVTVAVPSRFLSSDFESASPTRFAPTSTPRANAITAKYSQATEQAVSNLGIGEPGRALLFFWLLGALVVGSRFGRQILSARRLVRRASIVDNALMRGSLSHAKSSLGIRRDITVLHSSEIDVPLAAGILRPVILVPSSASEWSDEEMRIVLLHELAHVQRSDIIARATAMCACVIHWFNPFVWILGELSTRDAELAADDLVLSAGILPSTYADALLNIAGSVFGPPRVQPSLPLARRAFLAERVHTILRESRRSGGMGHAATALVLAATFATSLLAACVRFAAEPSPTLGSVTNGIASLTPVITRKYEPSGPPRASARDAAQAVAPFDSSWVDAAVVELIRALGDSSPQVRMAAAHSLGRLHARPALSRLSALASDPDKNVRYEANLALNALDRR